MPPQPPSPQQPQEATREEQVSAEALPECVICRDVMRISEPRLGMPCGHAFHEACIKQYADCKGISVELACPFRCGPFRQSVENIIESETVGDEVVDVGRNTVIEEDTEQPDFEAELEQLLDQEEAAAAVLT